MTSLATAFTDATRRRLLEEYLPRVREAVTTLGPDGLWWRPHADTTSVGNLLLHLEGNVRQWILSGLGGRSDARERRAEFDAREGGDAATLLAALQATVVEACAVIGELDEAALLRERRIQGFEVSGLAAVYHVLEHFGWHAGQITWIAKARAGAGHGIAFYDDAALADARNAEREPS